MFIMSEQFKLEISSEKELIFEQTKGGAYDSIPSAEDVLEEMGIKDESEADFFKYDETSGGAYDSKPNVEDVLFELGLTEDKENDWEQVAGNRGHGEYVRNVEAAVAFCKMRGVKTKEGVQEILGKAGPSTTYVEYAMNRGHGEYVANVKKAAEFCRANGVKSKEGIEKILSQARVQDK